MTTPTTITNATDCLQHIKYAIDEHDFRLAVLYIELLVAQECHKAVTETLKERYQATTAIINRAFPESSQ